MATRGETVPGSILDDLDRIEEIPGLAERVEQRRSTNGAAATPRARKVSTPPPPYKEGMFVEPLQQLYMLMGLGFAAVGKENSAIAILENSEDCARSLDEWAKTSPKVRKALAPLLNAGGFGKVAMAHAPIAMAIVGDMAPKYAEAMMKVGARIGQAFMKKADRENG